MADHTDTKTIDQFLAENPDVDVTRYWERCWGILEQHWNGALLLDAETMLQWAMSMTWKGIRPVVELSRTVYAKGVALTKKAMRAAETRLLRNPELPKWGILIRPACLV